MQIHGLSNVNAAAVYSKPHVAATTAETAKIEQPSPRDQVTLSQAAKQMSVSQEPETSAEVLQQAELSIDSGNYTVIGTALAGHLVELLIY